MGTATPGQCSLHRREGVDGRCHLTLEGLARTGGTEPSPLPSATLTTVRRRNAVLFCGWEKVLTRRVRIIDSQRKARWSHQRDAFFTVVLLLLWSIGSRSEVCVRTVRKVRAADFGSLLADGTPALNIASSAYRPLDCGDMPRFPWMH
jgi:hypothetical protein